MKIDLLINPQETTDNIIEFIQNVFKKAGKEKAVIGVSGGIDSAVSFVLTTKALGIKNIYPVTLPYGVLNAEGENDVELLLRLSGCSKDNYKNVDIQSVVEKLMGSIGGSDDLRTGNIMARTRMVILYDLAKKLDAMVMGTENRTEHLLGYFTRFGDEASDIEPIIHLYKTQVRQLALFLKIPEKIINKPPTAGFWNGQTDEGEMGFSYKDADQILSLYFDKNLKIEDIIQKGFDRNVVGKVIGLTERNRFKKETPYHL
jgi:NAD+ synthase